jgi:hypothetical protein
MACGDFFGGVLNGFFGFALHIRWLVGWLFLLTTPTIASQTRLASIIFNFFLPASKRSFPVL